jgi:hypothetical protein
MAREMGIKGAVAISDGVLDSYLYNGPTQTNLKSPMQELLWKVAVLLENDRAEVPVRMIRVSLESRDPSGEEVLLRLIRSRWESGDAELTLALPEEREPWFCFGRTSDNQEAAEAVDDKESQRRVGNGVDSEPF